MPRKRTIADDALLDAALGIVHETGPASLTFAALAPRVGLAPSTIVQRFGTKAGLLRAALLRAWDQLDERTAAASRAAATGPSGVVELLGHLSGQYAAHDFADQLLVLREDLRDPALRARGEAWLATLTAEIDRRLGAGPGNGAGLGREVVAFWQGTVIVWSFTREGPVESVVRTGLESLLPRVASGRG
jgi:AcrR family transcriptional regulator